MEEGGSAGSSFEILNRNDDFILSNIENVYPILRKCFSDSADNSKIIRALGLAFGPCLESFDVGNLEENLLKYACPCARHVFIQTIRELDSMVNHSGDAHINLLKLCEEIISLLNNVFGYTSSYAWSLKLSKIGSLLTCSSEVLYESYDHCVRSGRRFNSHYSLLTDALTSLFKKTQDLQCNIVQLMSHIEVNCEHHEVCILNSILTFCYKAGMSLLQLDVKTMADLWKGYTFILGKYSDLLKNHHDVSVPIQCLTVNLINNLNSFISGENINVQKFPQTIKILSFILKIVIKLIEKFNGHLKDCHKELLNLLISLNKMNSPHFQLLNSENINADDLKPLVIGIEPLLKFLMRDKDFAHEFAVMSKNTAAMSPSTRVAFLLLCCLIIKKLIICDAKIRSIWFNSEDNVIVWIFEIISSCNFELCLDLKFMSVFIPVKTQRMTDCFEYLLTYICAFLMGLQSKEFILAEKILVKYLLQKNPWCSLLAADIWCILARFADSELCYNQLSRLCSMLLQFGNWSLLPEKLFLESLISRLFPLLSQKHRDLLSEVFPPKNYSYLWHVFDMEGLSGQVLNSVKASVRHLTLHYISMFLSGAEFHAADFLKMEAILSGSNVNSADSDDNVENNIANLWKFDPSKLVSNPSNKRYLKIICKATSPVISFMIPKNIFLVLQQIKLLIKNIGSNCKLYCLENIDQLGQAFIPEGDFQPGILGLIGFLFSELLRDENVFVRIRSMEVFSLFASFTCHAQIVSSSVINDEALKVRIRNYLLQQHSSFEKDWKISHYLEKLDFLTYIHFCPRANVLELHENSSSEPLKKIIFDKTTLGGSEIESLISSLRNQVMNVRQYSKCLSSAQKKELFLIGDFLCTILKKSTL